MNIHELIEATAAVALILILFVIFAAVITGNWSIILQIAETPTHGQS